MCLLATTLPPGMTMLVGDRSRSGKEDKFQETVINDLSDPSFLKVIYWSLMSSFVKAIHIMNSRTLLSRK
jgi:hypothetical protein